MKLAPTIVPFLALLSACSLTVQAPQPSSPPPPSSAKQEEIKPSSAPAPLAESPAPPSKAASGQLTPACSYAAGTAVGGQSINLDVCSVKSRNAQSVAFVYYLGSERIESEANCANGTWTTFPEGKVNQPQSAATQNMLTTVCGRRDSSSAVSSTGTAIVFDPPSNVRVSPNGEILCSVKERTSIRILGAEGSWYKTDVCGSPGFIQAGQLQF